MSYTPSKTALVTEALKNEICSGKYRCGEKLPSYRELTERFQVSSMVIHQAAGRLQELGLVECSARSGIFIPDRRNESRICGFITGIKTGYMDHYFENFLQSCSEASWLPMMVLNGTSQIEAMLHKKPLQVLIDLGCKDMPFSRLQELTRDFSTIYCGRFEHPDCQPESAVLYDWAFITEMTLRHFIECGHKKILFISHDASLLEYKRRELTEAGKKTGLNFGTPEFQWCSCDDFTRNPGRVSEIFRSDPPTAFFARGDHPLYEFDKAVRAFFPDAPPAEKIGAYDSLWSTQNGHEFSSWHWDWKKFWTQVFNHPEGTVEYYQPELILRCAS